MAKAAFSVLLQLDGQIDREIDGQIGLFLVSSSDDITTINYTPRTSASKTRSMSKPI